VTDDVGSTFYLSASTVAVEAPPTPGSTISLTTIENFPGNAGMELALWTFYGDGAGTTVFTWYLCDNPITVRPESLPNECTSQGPRNYSLIDGGQKYATTTEVQPHMIGKYLLVSSQATNTAGTKTIWSLGSSKIVGVPALNSSPSVSGSSTVGSLITAATGLWLSESEVTYAYQWYRCALEIPYDLRNADPYSCVLISGATSSTHTSVTADEGLHLSVKITATNSFGSGYPTYARSLGVTGAPGFTTGPLITGTATKASTLTAGGVLKGLPVPVRTQAWHRCESAVNEVASTLPAGCVAITGATASTYVLADADTSFYISVRQTLTSTAGVITRWSPTTTQVVGPPINTVVPSVSGTPMAGEVLTADVGTWRATPTATYSYAWYTCSNYWPNGYAGAVPVNCTAIPSATSSTYTISQNYYGKGINVYVTATNSSGSSTFMSSPSGTIESLPFTITEPNVSGFYSASSGNVFTISPGTWVGYTPPSTTYRWYRCTTIVSAVSTTLPANCSVIPSRTLTQYTLSSEDVGKYVTAEVIATNNKGTVSKWAISTASVTQSPSMSTEPVLTGTSTSGQTLSVTPGTWTATPTATISYQWMRCTQQVNSLSSSKPAYCNEITGEVSETYVLTAQDVGKYITVQETATNSAGTAIRLTPSTSIVT
jgi:hypothetical protein